MAKKSKYGKTLGRPSSGQCTKDQTRRLNACKMAARKTKPLGIWPNMKTYGLTPETIQRIRDGHSRNYEIAGDDNLQLLKYNPPEEMIDLSSEIGRAHV